MDGVLYTPDQPKYVAGLREIGAFEEAVATSFSGFVYRVQPGENDGKRYRRTLYACMTCAWTWAAGSP